MKAWVQRIGGGLLVAAIATGFWYVLWKGPWWFDGDHLRHKDLQPADGIVITGLRTALLALGAGVIAGLTLYYTHRNHQQTVALFEHTRAKDREQAELTREGQVTERYVEAIKLLASVNSLTERLGGVYSLERIMRDSEKDHGTVVDVLAAHVRQRASKSADDLPPHGSPPSEDVRAAMIVIGRRPRRDEPFRVNLAGVRLHLVELKRAQLPGAFLDYADLSAADLEGADLTAAHLHKADLSAADVTDATLADARLSGARLRRTTCTGADLSHADLASAELREARLEFADLRGADLRGAIMTKARMNQARLNGADLRGVDMSEVLDLDLDQLCKARFDADTQLPPNIAAHPQVQARLAQLERGIILSKAKLDP